MNRIIFTLSLILVFICKTHATESFSIERIFQSPALAGTTVRNIQVSPDGKRVTFLRGKASDYEQFDLWEYHIASDKTRLLFDSNDLHTGDEALSDEEKARRERMRLSGSGIVQYSWSSAGDALLFPLAGDVYYHKIGTVGAKRLLHTSEFETDIKLSPKGQYISYIRNQNLYIKNIEDGTENAITTQGGGNIKFGMAEFVAQEEMSRMTGYWWSSDDKHIAFTKVDETPVMDITRSEIYADRIATIKQKYPKAGSNNVLINLAVANIQTKEVEWVNLGENKDIYLARASWMSPSKLTFQVQSRDQKHLTLNAYDLTNKKVSELLTENSNTWVNLHDDLKFLANNEGFIWASERDGFKHLYWYSEEGRLKKQLTKGDWVVEQINAINNKSIFLQARKDTPLESHVYSLNIDNGELQRITESGWYNSATFSKDASIFVNLRSNANTPAQVSLHTNNGKRLTWLNENKIDKAHPLYTYADSWIKPSFGSFSTKDKKTDEELTLYYRLYKPKNIDTKRPAIVYLYGGPGVQVVNNKWGGNRGLLMQYWVNKGYVVFSIDNRGSKQRGKAFEDAIYRSMGAVEVQDQVAGVEFLRTFDFVDPSRVGVYGHSYGGYMALMTMFKAPEHFAAGVSGAPVSDWRLYDTHYTERYMGDPRTMDSAYTASSVFPYAKNLKGDLLIYHGMADDNVLFTHSTMLYKHLQDLALPFEVMDYPGKKHSIRGKNTGIHLYNTITRFFDKHLIGQ
jgi:dipeptidyl-peptidase-4